MKTFNGHKSWDYWNVSLWINNDEGLYHLAIQARKQQPTLREAAQWFLEAVGEVKTPDGARYNLARVSAAIKDALS